LVRLGHVTVNDDVEFKVKLNKVTVKVKVKARLGYVCWVRIG
jgi:uncharacterized protein (DUF1499 family)